MPRLFQRRDVLLPRLWGWLLLLALLGAAALRVARQLDAAAACVRAAGCRSVLTSGGPIPSVSPFASFAERAADRLRQKLPEMVVEALPTPAAPA